MVGLGNPGKQYAGTRHNVGYEVVRQLIARHATSSPKAKFQGEVVEVSFQNEKVLLLFPLTFMNLSGGSVLEARDFYKIQNEDLLVICDDLALPVAKLRFRQKGSSGGQKGLADIIQRLGTEEFSRLRIGIGSPQPGRDVPGYVLGKFPKEEQVEIEIGIQSAADAVADWVCKGIDHCMNVYNA